MLFQLSKGSDLLFIPAVSSDGKTVTVRASTPTQAFMSMRHIASSIFINTNVFPDYIIDVLFDVHKFTAVLIQDIYTPDMYVDLVRKALLQAGATNITVHGIGEPDQYLGTLLPIIDSTADFDTINSELMKFNFSLFFNTLITNAPALNGTSSPFGFDQEECGNNMHVFTLVKE